MEDVLTQYPLKMRPQLPEVTKRAGPLLSFKSIPVNPAGQMDVWEWLPKGRVGLTRLEGSVK